MKTKKSLSTPEYYWAINKSLNAILDWATNDEELPKRNDYQNGYRDGMQAAKKIAFQIAQQTIIDSINKDFLERLQRISDKLTQALEK